MHVPHYAQNVESRVLTRSWWDVHSKTALRVPGFLSSAVMNIGFVPGCSTVSSCSVPPGFL